MSLLNDIKPCVLYETKLDVTKMEQFKLEHNNRSKKIPIYSAKHGVEGLLHVIDKFNKNAAKLNMNAVSRWDNFEDVLDTTAETKWNNQIQGIGAPARTNNRLLREQLNFVHAYTGAEAPRDVMFDYLDQSQGPCRKRPSADCMTHANRIETLCNIANRLQGTKPIKDPANIKLTVFRSFPGEWQLDYKLSAHDFAADEISDIVAFMDICKVKADADYKGKTRKRKADDDPERIRGGGRYRGRGTYRGNRYKSGKNSKDKSVLHDNDPCPVHAGKHKWGECSLNPRSSNYDPNQANRHNSGYNRDTYHNRRNDSFQGRGGGRFGGGRFGGRGHGAGRGFQREQHYYGRNDQHPQGRNDQYANERTWPSDQYHYDARRSTDTSRRGTTRDHTRESGEW